MSCYHFIHRKHECAQQILSVHCSKILTLQLHGGTKEKLKSLEPEGLSVSTEAPPRIFHSVLIAALRVDNSGNAY